MSATTFNAITYANKLKDAGMATRIADVQAEEMSEFINSTLATKDDLRILKIELQGFMVKGLVVAISLIVTLQNVVQFMK